RLQDVCHGTSREFAGNRRQFRAPRRKNRLLTGNSYKGAPAAARRRGSAARRTIATRNLTHRVERSGARVAGTLLAPRALNPARQRLKDERWLQDRYGKDSSGF